MTTTARPVPVYSPPPTRRAPVHLPALDGLRGVAILLVLLQHAGVLSVGWLGVDLFFALSGFLITGILLDAKASGASAGAVLRPFYARRALRIFPLGFLLLALVFGALPLVTGHGTPLRDQAWYWLYASNWRPGEASGALVYLRHFWSLAVEEQFYLVWPVVVLALPARRLGWACGAVLVGGLLLRLALPYTNFGTARAMLSLTVTRADALAVGAWLALLARGAFVCSSTTIRRVGIVAGLLVVALLARQGHGAPDGVLMRSIGITLVALAMGAVVQEAATMRRGVLTAPWLTALGQISYGVYVYHAPIAVWLQGHVASVALRLVLVSVTAIPLAWCSWRYFESPILAEKRRFPMPVVARSR